MATYYEEHPDAIEEVTLPEVLTPPSTPTRSTSHSAEPSRKNSIEAKKSPMEPKKNSNAYQFYQREMRSLLKSKYPNWSANQIRDELNSRWKKLSVKDRAVSFYIIFYSIFRKTINTKFPLQSALRITSPKRS